MSSRAPASAATSRAHRGGAGRSPRVRSGRPAGRPRRDRRAIRHGASHRADPARDDRRLRSARRGCPRPLRRDGHRLVDVPEARQHPRLALRARHGRIRADRVRRRCPRAGAGVAGPDNGDLRLAQRRAQVGLAAGIGLSLSLIVHDAVVRPKPLWWHAATLACALAPLPGLLLAGRRRRSQPRSRRTARPPGSRPTSPRRSGPTGARCSRCSALLPSRWSSSRGPHSRIRLGRPDPRRDRVGGARCRRGGPGRLLGLRAHEGHGVYNAADAE